VTPDEPVPSSVPRWLARSAAWSWRVLVVAGALVLIGLAFVRLRVIVVPVVAALFVTTVLSPPAVWLRRRGLPALVATWIVFLLAGAVVAGVVFGVLPGLETEFGKLGQALGTGVSQAEQWLVHGPLHLSRHQVHHLFAQATSVLNSHRQALIHGALTGVSVAASVLAGVLLTVVLSFFFVKDGASLARWFTGWASPARAMEMEELGRRAWGVLTGYIRGTALNGAVNALVLALTLLALGVPLVGALALLTFVGGFLPLVGGVLSGLVAAVVALVAKGPIAAGVVVGATILIHNLEGYLVGPFVLGRAVRLHPVAVILVLGIGTILGGVVGAFLAVPVAGVVLAVAGYYRQQRDPLERSAIPGLWWPGSFRPGLPGSARRRGGEPAKGADAEPEPTAR